MKKLLMSVAALSVLAGPALAADMSVPVTKAPAMVAPAAYNWSGFYSATTVGGAWWNVDGDYVNGSGDHHNTSDNKFLFGGYYGAQYQWNNWVIGVEAGYTGLFGSDYANSVSPERGSVSRPQRTEPASRAFAIIGRRAVVSVTPGTTGWHLLPVATRMAASRPRRS